MPSPSVVSEPAAGHVLAAPPSGAACRHGSESVIQTPWSPTKEDRRECLAEEGAREGER
jgi:hypothetical protein